MAGNRQHVLVVDDDPVICDLFQRTLRRASFSVETANRARDALARLSDPRPIDLMIVDLRLDEGYDGRTLASIASDLRPSLRILFISGYDPPPFDPDFRRHDFMLKPVVRQELIGRAAEILRRDRCLRRAA
jgi:DNA-binding NtrC family response regulator